MSRQDLHRCVLALFFFAVLDPLQARAQLSEYIPITPCRVVDTRNPVGSLGGPIMSANSSRSFPLASGPCGLPTNASAYAIDITVVPAGPVFHYLTIWPTGQTQPNTSALHATLGEVVSNEAIVPAGTAGAVSVYVYDSSNVVLDVNGYFISSTNTNTYSTALGTGASSVGAQNTALGFNTLATNNTGAQNVATGSNALYSNTSGNNNVAIGAAALEFSASGSANTALGTESLLNNLIGNSNTATGFSALLANTVGSGNTAVGAEAMTQSTTGGGNTAVGGNALYANTNGSFNIAIGNGAGDLISNGSYNIDIGNEGTNSDSGTIRIGNSSNQTSTFVAGINNVNIPNGATVLINSNGQLGTIQSSARYKQDIQDMGDKSDALMKLRPVTFHYRLPADLGQPSPLQFGLVAEEVADVYPELAIYGPNGQIESVAYHELPALLLNELQKQHSLASQQQQVIDNLRNELEQQKAELRVLSTELNTIKKRGAAK